MLNGAEVLLLVFLFSLLSGYDVRLDAVLTCSFIATEFPALGGAYTGRGVSLIYNNQVYGSPALFIAL